MFTVSVMFKGHLMNFSASFEEMRRKGLSNSFIFKINPAYCQEGSFFLKRLFKGEFAMLVHLKETGRTGFAPPGALSLVG